VVTDKDSFRVALNDVLDYIAQDSLEKAINFKRELQSKLDTIAYMPYKYRKSIYFDNNEIRDYIFKGYTIPYLIDADNNELVILDIFKWINK